MMMPRSTSAAFAFVIFCHAVCAIPPTPPTPHTLVAPPASTPSNILPEHGGVEPSVADANHPILSLCLSPGCDLDGGSSCKFGADMTAFTSGCFAAPFAFSSFILTQQFVTGPIPFKVAVGTTNCASEFVIPTLNQCFNASPGTTLNSFARIG
ncbi:hypothetical protein C8Q79DRAFT_7949 [Trametes meyenii]|nr:hypothetical protein C8Q79DRAFT_7949 [Trametes meyenii]